MAVGGAALHNWLQRRRMQYNVTMPLYMLSPAERFVFNSIVFLITAMIVIAAILYLPEHIATISARVAYYWHGGTLVELTGAASGKSVAAAAAANAAAQSPLGGPAMMTGAEL